MDKFIKLDSRVAVLDIDNIDTDQIIGSDFLKITNKEGLGKHLFSDWRYLNSGEEDKGFVLNQPKTKGAKVLVTGDNFGCGSSREHAPWALLDFGIKVVITSSIADIFFNNSIKNGLLPIQVTQKEQKFLLSRNGESIQIDLEKQNIVCGDREIFFEIEPFAKYCLLNGMDQIDFLFSQLDQIKEYENKLNEF